MPTPLAVTNLAYRNMSVRNWRARHCLMDWGDGFHIEQAKLDLTPAGVKRLTALGLTVAGVTTLAQLTAAYQAWHGAATEAERRRLPLLVAKSYIPADAPDQQRLERRVLLSLARYIDIDDTLIMLTPDGEAAYERAYGELGIRPGLVRTLDRLADSPYDLSGHHISKVLAAARAVEQKK